MDEFRRQLREQYPDMEEYIGNIVKDWPPMSAEAIRLCRQARRIHLASLVDQEATQETK